MESLSSIEIDVSGGKVKCEDSYFSNLSLQCNFILLRSEGRLGTRLEILAFIKILYDEERTER